MQIKNPPYSKDNVGLEAVIVTPEYMALKLAQRKFLVRYINQAAVHGVYDAADAIKCAYGAGTKNADLRAYQLLRTKAVQRLLDIHFRRAGLESILSDLRRAARKSVKMKVGLTPATVKALAAFEAYVATKDASHD